MKIKFMAAAVVAFSTLLSVTAFAADKENPFTDVDLSTQEGQAIEKMYDAGFLSGYKDGTFRPEAYITRAELTRVFNQVFKYDLNEENADMPDFVDVQKNAWYYNDVRIAQTNGYINGFKEDNTFRPQSNFTRQQTCVVIALAAGLQAPAANITINDPVAPWAVSYVKSVIATGVFELEENSTFRATANITRGEVCKALAKYVTDGNSAIVIPQVSDENTEVVTDSTGKVVGSSHGGGSGGSSGGGGGGGSSSSGSGGGGAGGSTSGAGGSTNGSTSGAGGGGTGSGSTNGTGSGSTSGSGNGSTNGSGSGSTSGSGSGSTSGSGSGSGSGSTSGSGSGSTNGNTPSKPSGSTTTTTTEATTEETTQEPSGGENEGIILTDSQKRALERVIDSTETSLRYNINKNSEGERALVEFILQAMLAFQADNTYDVVSDVNVARAMYDALTPAEQDDFENVAIGAYDTGDIDELEVVFGPLFGY